MKVPSEQVFVGMPSYDRRIDVHCMLGLMHCMPCYGRTYFNIGMSNICLARNEIADVFLKTTHDWFMMIDSDTVFTREDWNLLWEGEEDVVTAEYAKKIIGERPVSFGLGFTRVHRRVFTKIAALLTDDGADYAQRFYHKGAMMVNYFPNGANAAGRWIGEDHGFFNLCSMTDVIPRVETRTKLRHVGTFEFGYPDQIPGFKMIETEGAQ